MTFVKENYRCIRKPNNLADLGQWEFLYKGKWHDVKSCNVRIELNNLFGY